MQKTEKNKKKIKRLPKSKNGIVRSKTIATRTYGWQHEEAKKKAKKLGMSLSYYLQWKSFHDWM